MKITKATPPGQPAIEVQVSARERLARKREEAAHRLKLQAIQYQFDRKQEYFSVEEQLDFIVKYGITAYRTMMLAIKKKYPKPE